MRALFIRGQQVIFVVFIDIKEISLPVDRGGARHAADLPGSAEKARFLEGVFRAQPKQLD